MTNKYQVLCNIEIKNIFLTINYNTQESERVPIIMKWLGQEGFRFMQILSDKEKEKCRTCTGLFKVLTGKLNPQCNETILSLQYCKLTRKQNKNVTESVGYLRIKAKMNISIRKKTEGYMNNL